MASNEKATLTLVVKKVGDQALSGIKTAIKGIGIAAAAAVAGLASFAAAAVALGREAAQFDSVRQSFHNLAASQGQDADKMLNKMRELSQGTISDMKLMQQANQALLLGLPVDKFGDMLEIARSSAKATGQSMDFMLNSIVTGLGRGSKLMLDNLGIVFKIEDAYDEYAKTLGKTADQLSEAEKKQAFINKALAVGKANAEAAGGGQLTLSERFDQTTAKMENMRIVVGKYLTPTLSFLLDKTQQLFVSIEKWVQSSTAQGFFETLTKIISRTIIEVDSFGKSFGTTLASMVEGHKKLLQGDFKAAFDIFKLGAQEQARIHKEAVEQRNAETSRIEEDFAKASITRAVDTEKAKQLAVMQERMKQQQAEEEAEIAKEVKALEKKEADLAFIGATEAEKLDLQIKAQDKAIEQATTHDQKMNALKTKSRLLDQKAEMAQTAFNAEQQKQREADQRSTLSTIASLSRSNNQTLAVVGKAAALTQIAIQAPVGVSRALAAFPPPVNFIAAGAVAAAFAAQAANVAGIRLAEGGIVPATPGGIQATIGEGGRSEAVIPLPDDFDPDSGGIGNANINITFAGPLMGDEQTAREMARKIDEELLKLRQRNESVSFEGVI